MLLDRILSRMRSGAPVCIQGLADDLGEDPGTIKHAVILLCRMEYCEQVTVSAHKRDPGGPYPSE